MTANSRRGPLNWSAYCSGLVSTEAKLPDAGRELGLIQVSSVSGAGRSRELPLPNPTVSFEPSNEAALSLSPVSRPAAPRAGPPVYTPAFAPFWSKAVVPLASPKRHQLTGLSVVTAAA